MTTTAIRPTSREDLRRLAGVDLDPHPFERTFVRQVWVTVDVNRHGDPEDRTVAAWWMARARRQRREALWARYAHLITTTQETTP
jgi:hypothetical protein